MPSLSRYPRSLIVLVAAAAERFVAYTVSTTTRTSGTVTAIIEASESRGLSVGGRHCTHFGAVYAYAGNAVVGEIEKYVGVLFFIVCQLRGFVSSVMSVYYMLSGLILYQLLYEVLRFFAVSQERHKRIGSAAVPICKVVVEAESGGEVVLRLFHGTAKRVLARAAGCCGHMAENIATSVVENGYFEVAAQFFSTNAPIS